MEDFDDSPNSQSTLPTLDLQERTHAARLAAYKKAPPWLPDYLMILIRAGSHAYDVALPTSDIDLRGVTLAPKRSYLGFAQTFHDFNCKEPDTSIAELRSFMRSAAHGDLQALQVLFCDERDVLHASHTGWQLREMRDAFLSQRVVKPMAGYARGMIAKVRAWERQVASGHPLSHDLGKAAMHASRVTLMLREVLRGEGLNVRRPNAEFLLSMRSFSTEQALTHVRAAEDILRVLLPEWIEKSTLQKEPDDEALDNVCQELVEQSFSQLPAW